MFLLMCHFLKIWASYRVNANKVIALRVQAKMATPIVCITGSTRDNVRAYFLLAKLVQCACQPKVAWLFGVFAKRLV